MPRPDHSGMIDGYTSVQALRRLDGKAPPGPHVPPPEKEASAGVESATEETPKSLPFGHTALPTRHDLICYNCGYAFVVTGRLDKVLCPKCKTWLKTGDHHIDGAWSGTLKTVGCVYINSGASVSSSHIMATDIRVAGSCRNCRLEPTRHLELDSGAHLELDQLAERQLVVVAGARLVLDEPLRCRSLDVFGELQAEVRLSERGAIHSGGFFRGSFYAPRLVVEEGARLRAFIHVESADRKPGTPKVPATGERAGSGQLPSSANRAR